MRLFRFGFLILSVSALNAYASPFLGSAATFAVLGAATVTNTGATTLYGNLGVAPGSAITGAGTITIDNGVRTTLSVAQTAQNDASASNLITGYGALVALGATSLSPNLGTGGVVALSAAIGPGNTVFNLGTGAAQLTGDLTLSFTGNDQNIVFQIGTGLTTASASRVLLLNVGTDDNVYWAVGSSATLGSTTSFAGSIIAQQSVTMVTGATDGCGSVIALVGQVALQGNKIGTGCTIGSGGAVTPAPIGGTVIPGGTVTLPEGGSTLLYLCFMLVPIGVLRAFRGRRSA
jgi:type VI secretion system secreted protein VgrG